MKYKNQENDGITSNFLFNKKNHILLYSNININECEISI